MAYGEFYVEHQGWARWPKTLIMCRKRGHEVIERRRYVPERTCHIIGFDDGVDEGIDGEWHQYAEPQYDLSCGHSSQGAEAPHYCPNCGRKVES